MKTEQTFKRLPRPDRHEYVVHVPTAKDKYCSITIHDSTPPKLPFRGAKVYQVVPGKDGRSELRHIPEEKP